MWALICLQVLNSIVRPVALMNFVTWEINYSSLARVSFWFAGFLNHLYVGFPETGVITNAIEIFLSKTSVWFGPEAWKMQQPSFWFEVEARCEVQLLWVDRFCGKGMALNRRLLLAIQDIWTTGKVSFVRDDCKTATLVQMMDSQWVFKYDVQIQGKCHFGFLGVCRVQICWGEQDRQGMRGVFILHLIVGVIWFGVVGETKTNPEQLILLQEKHFRNRAREAKTRKNGWFRRIHQNDFVHRFKHSPFFLSFRIALGAARRKSSRKIATLLSFDTAAYKALFCRMNWSISSDWFERKLWLADCWFN